VSGTPEGQIKIPDRGALIFRQVGHDGRVTPPDPSAGFQLPETPPDVASVHGNLLGEIL